jgi:formylglycine-generating enzyme required for sulfatase activity
MSELDLLFWLFVLLLAGLGYSIEAGLANQHRTLLLSTMASVTLASVYLMFAVEDTSSFDTTRPDPLAQEADDGDGEELGTFEFAGKKKKKTAGPVNRGLGGGPAERTEHESDKLKGPFNDCEGCPTMVPVKAGGFTLGSPPTEAGRNDTEGPARGIRIARDFAIGQFELTRDEYALFIKEANYVPSRTCEIGGRRVTGGGWQSPGFDQSGKHPVVCVSWRDAKAYVNWLKVKANRPYRLPSETEWEYAARAGTKSAYSFGNDYQATMVNAGRRRNGTTPVGDTGVNKLNLADMHGNVWELLEDCWSADLSFLPDGGRPLGILGDCSRRSIRGGGWDSPPEHVRSATRGAAGESAALSTIGFRVARDLVELVEGPDKKLVPRK